MGKSGQTDTIRLFNTHYSEDIAEYKRFAENHSNAYRYNQEYLTDLTYRIKDYLTEQQAKEEPFTITGLYMALDMQKKDYYRARNGEFDWKLYQFMDFKGISFDDIETTRDDLLGYLQIWTDENGQIFICNTYSEIIEKSLLVIQSKLEIICYTGDNPKGAIFILKSRFGWSDRPDQRQTSSFFGSAEADNTTSVLNHIATAEEAKQAIAELQEQGIIAGNEADLYQDL